MIRKYHNHKPQTTPLHREEESLNLRVTFQSHIRFARKVQIYGDAYQSPLVY